jgi:hypothetical protein
MSKAHRRAWSYLLVEPGFQRRRCVDNWWTSISALAPRIHNYNKMELGTRDSMDCLRIQNMVVVTGENVKMSREKP